MNRRWKMFGLAAASALGTLLPLSGVQASSDVTCSPTWALWPRELSCENRVVISPANDTRVNLLLLLRDAQQAGPPTSLVYPEADYPGQDFGRTFFDWGRLQAGYWPQADGDGDAYGGSICVSLASGSSDFAAAIAANRKLPAGERDLLATARERLAATCDHAQGAAAGWPSGIASPVGRAFLGYLQAADAFYAGQWDQARTGFAALRKTPDTWVTEAAAYMLARTDLNAAMAAAFDEYGDFSGPAKVDQAAIQRARLGFQAYALAYPAGAYVQSARGLVRRALWLSGDLRGLSGLYEGLLARVPAGDPASARLVQEIDNKLLFAKDAMAVMDGPLLLATMDLMLMRQYQPNPWNEPPVAAERVLTALELAGQEKQFASRPDLFRYLQAVHAYTIQRDMRQVLTLVPDDAHRAAYQPLAFSAQVLRGLALTELRDPNAAGFWRDLLGGATALWQRPTVELALAMHLERHGRLADVFAAGSPIEDRTIREILLMHAADAALLRAAAGAHGRPGHERDVALFTLLYKQLSRGDYAGFVASRRLIAPDADKQAGLWDFIAQDAIPVGLFATGKSGGEGFACPALEVTAGTLARAPADIRARLCLGEFWRLNGFDQFSLLDSTPGPDELGGTPTRFAGTPLGRGAIYAGVIASKNASAPDKAYALYRAVMCYAPGGNNSCGGPDVSVRQRKAWHDQLKRDYPQSTWAQSLRYYW